MNLFESVNKNLNENKTRASIKNSILADLIAYLRKTYGFNFELIDNVNGAKSDMDILNSVVESYLADNTNVSIEDFFDSLVDYHGQIQVIPLDNGDDLSEGEIHTVDNDPAWAAAVAKVNAQHDEDKPALIEQLKDEYRDFVRSLLRAGFTKDEILKLPETKAYSDAIKDPDDIWCECGSDTDGKYKEDGSVYLGVEKHGWICPKCKKFTQIG